MCKVRFPKLSVDCVLNKRKPRLRKHLQIKDVLHWIALYTRTIQCWTVLRQQTTHRCKQESTCQTAVRCEQHSVISLLCVSLMICRVRQPAHDLTGVSKPICMHLLWQTHRLSSLQILDNEHLGLCVCKCLSFALEGSRPKVLNSCVANVATLATHECQHVNKHICSTLGQDTVKSGPPDTPPAC